MRLGEFKAGLDQLLEFSLAGGGGVFARLVHLNYGRHALRREKRGLDVLAPDLAARAGLWPLVLRQWSGVSSGCRWRGSSSRLQ